MTATTIVTRLSATEIVRSIAAGDLSCREVVDAHIDRIEEVDGALNAVVIRRFDEARREADGADAARGRGDALGPLHGVPVTIKDQFHVAGLPTTFGTTRLAESVAPADGPTVAAWRRAGAIVLGKGNVPQGLAAAETDNDLFGRTNNPWDLERTPGGSSGGEAAIVAAGGAALGLGADLGGSLRVPSAWCGLATLNPTSRRLAIDRTPVRSAFGVEGIVAQPGPFARTTADVALAARVLAEAAAARPNGTNPPAAWSDPEQVDVSRLRVALLPEVAGWTAAPAVRRALAEAAAALRAQGATVEDWTDAPDTQAGLDLTMRLYTADGFAAVSEGLGGDRPHKLIKADLQLARMPHPVLRALAAVLGRTGQARAARIVRNVGRLTAAEMMDALGDRLSYEGAFLGALDAGGYDAVLTPALPIPAPRHGATPDLADFWAGAAVLTLVGLPAGVVPITRVRAGEESDRPASRDKVLQAARAAEQGSAGLPVCVQVAARHWREDVVLAVMAALEEHAAGEPDFPSAPPL